MPQVVARDMKPQLPLSMHWGHDCLQPGGNYRAMCQVLRPGTCFGPAPVFNILNFRAEERVRIIYKKKSPVNDFPPARVRCKKCPVNPADQLLVLISSLSPPSFDLAGGIVGTAS